MTRSIKKLACLALGFVALSWVVSRVFDATVLHDSHTVRIDRGFRDLEAPVRVLFLGDSHTLRSVDPRVIDSAYDLASPGETTLRTYYRLRWVLEESPHAREIETIVFPVDVTTFATWNYLDFRPGSMWRRYLDYPDMSRMTGEPARVLQLALQGEFASFWNRRGDFVAWMELRIPGMRKHGEIDRGFVFQRGDIRGNPETRARRHFARRPLVNPVLEQYFRRSVQLALEHGKRVVLLEYPVQRRYAEIARRVFREAGVPVPTAEHLAKELGVSHLSARSLLFDRPELFWDADHLNGEGATVFSRWLLDRMDQSAR